MYAEMWKHKRQQLIDAFLAEQKRQREELDEKLRELEEKIAEAENVWSEQVHNPVVLVRSSAGSPRKVYHHAGDPCGRTQYDGGRQSGFMKMRESEAKLLNGGVLKRCSACWSH
ncbi:hypothetical protein ABZV14_26150 [Streptosporangium canum]|uniref:hypothetical protein n=1 Tax=Streptosporangium canum TaxID=324952 RepID=UPI0033B615D5